MNVRRVAVKIAYLGKLFSGSQIQPGLNTVEGQIISDLVTTGDGRPVEWFKLKVASRTDAGVNALGNVIVFNTTFRDNVALLRALNAVTKNVFYRSITDVDEDFNPRYANKRSYKYIVTQTGVDISKMRECSKIFIGHHDFKRFCRYDGKPTDTEIMNISVIDEDVISIMFESRFFLWNMVRRISAAIIEVGKGKATIEEVREVLNGREGTFGLGRADALTLTDIIYNGLEFKEYTSEPLSNRLLGLLTALELESEFYKSI
jgi:tRNA pseudouridine38-40 synthase